MDDASERPEFTEEIRSLTFSARLDPRYLDEGKLLPMSAGGGGVIDGVFDVEVGFNRGRGNALSGEEIGGSSGALVVPTVLTGRAGMCTRPLPIVPTWGGTSPVRL